MSTEEGKREDGEASTGNICIELGCIPCNLGSKTRFPKQKSKLKERTNL